VRPRGEKQLRFYYICFSSVDKICTDYSWSTLDGLWMDDFRSWLYPGRL